MKRTLVLGFFTLCLVVASLTIPPPAYPENATVVVEEGMTVQEVARSLSDQGAVSTPHAFSLAVRLMSGHGVQRGAYYLSQSENALSLAYRFSHGISGLVEKKVTIPEGFASFQMAERLQSVFPEFDTERFKTEAVHAEGYLFPDTYYFFPHVTPEYAIQVMRETFDAKVEPLSSGIADSGQTMEDIIIMASLLEEEAQSFEDRQTVAGILWKRLEAGMPLQVDAVFGYILGKSGYAPTGVDLEIDSPYNTYKHRGLPPGPITNPGLISIEAAINPIETEYWYYLTGKDGAMHYAETFQEHVANRKHLK